MTEQLHPMVPPNILLNNWESDWFDERQNVDVLLIQAYQAGADAELEACCEVLARELICDGKHVATDLRAIRRPKPLTLKEQALAVIENSEICDHLSIEHAAILRRALESLTD